MVSRPSCSSGFSLVEVLTTVAVIGIIAAIAVPTIGNVVEGSRKGVAENVVATLNKATKEFGYSQWDIVTVAAPATPDDEILILRSLQWRDPDTSGELNPKGPFMRPDWNPSTSNDTEDYRITWNGSAWRLLEPGSAGSGLRLLFDGSDLGTSVVHGADFSPVGAP